jgi:multiple sugar transport system permease protein
MVERRSALAKFLANCGLFLVIALSLAPLIWGALASLKPSNQLLTYPPTLLNFDATLHSYETVIAEGFLTGVRNSTFYAVLTIILGLTVGSLAAFGFDRFRFRGRTLTFFLVVASIPLALGAAALIVPKYLFFATLSLTNHWFTLPLIYGVHTLPMAIWVLQSGMEGVPRELDEAAYIDGASSLTVLWRVVLPLSLPALGASGFFLALTAWNEFVVGSVMVDAKNLKPIQPMLYAYIGFFGREWGALTAAAMISLAPILAFYVLFGRLLISGLTRGAIKS